MTAVPNRHRAVDAGLTRLRTSLHPKRAAPIGCAAALTISAVIGISLLWRPRPLLLWNASASSTIGLYAVASPARPRVGDMVVAWAPAAARRLAAARGYLPFNVPLVKRVGAAAGDRVCARGDRIYVNGGVAAVRRSHDPSQRRMPSWSGCKILRPGELFLLTRGMPNAFDGRYFGVTRRDELVGKARLLWAKPARDSSHG